MQQAAIPPSATGFSGGGIRIDIVSTIVVAIVIIIKTSSGSIISSMQPSSLSDDSSGLQRVAARACWLVLVLLPT